MEIKKTPEQIVADEARNAANTQIIITGLQKGDTKMAILTSLVRNDAALDLGAAGQLYKTVGTENKLILDKDAKDNLVVEIGAQFTVDGVLSREEAVEALCERGGMVKTSAVNRLKGYCAANKVEFPMALRTSRDMKAVNNAVKTWSEQNTPRESIEAGLIEHFGYTKKSVGQAYLKIGKELGLIPIEVFVGRTELAEWFADPENVKGNKKAVVAKLMADTIVAEATASTRYANYLFALEFMKATLAKQQEHPKVEAQEAA